MNTSEELRALRQLVDEVEATWASMVKAADQEEGARVYVLDAKGVIRFKTLGYGGKQSEAGLDAVVDQLLNEA